MSGHKGPWALDRRVNNAGCLGSNVVETLDLDTPHLVPAPHPGLSMDLCAQDILVPESASVLQGLEVPPRKKTGGEA